MQNTVVHKKRSSRYTLYLRLILTLLLTTAWLASAKSMNAQMVYEANASGNAIIGAAVVESCAGCLNGTRVGMIGNGNANYLRIKNISVPTTGTYVIALYYTEGTDGGARSFTIQVNNGHPNAWYKVVNVNDGLCLDVLNRSMVLGARLDQWTCGSSQANQQWQFTPAGNGNYQVNNLFVAMSWNVTGGVGATGTQVPIQLWSYDGASNEQWQAVYLKDDSNGNHEYKFIAQNDRLCLDVPGPQNTLGLQLDQNTCNGTDAQAFTLVEVTPASIKTAAPTSATPHPHQHPTRMPGITW